MSAMRGLIMDLKLNLVILEVENIYESVILQTMNSEKLNIKLFVERKMCFACCPSAIRTIYTVKWIHHAKMVSLDFLLLLFLF